MKSSLTTDAKISVFVFLMLNCILACSVILVYLNHGLTPELAGITLLSALFFIWTFFGEIKLRMISISIEGDKITVRKFLGLGKKRFYLFSQLDGFIASNYLSRGSKMEALYLIQKKRKIVKLSEFHISNFHSIQRVVFAKSKFLGDEDYSFAGEVMDIFNI